MKPKIVLFLVLGLLIAISVFIFLQPDPTPTLPINLKVISGENAAQIEKLVQIKDRGVMIALAFDSKTNFLASGNNGAFHIPGNIHLIDAHSGLMVDTINDFPTVRSVALSPDGRILAIGTEGFSNNPVTLWDVQSRKIAVQLNSHAGRMNKVVFSSDGKALASAGDDGTVRLWDVELQQLITIFYGHTHWVKSVAFSPDGKALASAGFDGTVRLWDVELRQPITVLYSHDRYVWDLAYNSQGTLLAGASGDLIQLWSTSDDRDLLRELHGHTGAVWSLSFSADGSILASVAQDNTLRLWDVEMGQVLAEIPFRNILGMQAVEFSPDGRLLAVALNGDIQLWGIPEQQ